MAAQTRDHLRLDSFGGSRHGWALPLLTPSGFTMHLRPHPRLRLATALVASLLLLDGGEVRAASKINIAVIGEAAPGGGQFLGPSLTGMPAAAGSGWVAFRTLVTDGKTPEQIVVARLAGQEERHVVAALGQSAGKRNGKDLGTFKQFLGRPAVNANGDVVFAASLTNSEALPGGLENLGDPLPAGIFLSRRGVPAAQALRIVALAREPVPGLGMLDLTTTIDLLETSTSLDLLERTPALNDAGAVAFLATTATEGFSSAPEGGIFVVDPAGGMTLRVRLGDTTPWGVITALGAPAMNAAGTLAFRGTTEDPERIEDGIFTLDGTALTRLAADGLTVVPPADPNSSQLLLGFGALVALNDAGDVAFAAGGMFDLTTFSSSEEQFGVLVVRAGGSPQLVTYPGLEVEAFGRVRSGNLGPDGGNEVALPAIGPDGSVYTFAQLTGDGGQAFFRAQPPDYELGLPLVVFGGSRPDPSPIGGVFLAAISPAAVDATGGLAFFSRLAGAPELEALIYRPPTGDGNLILVGQATPTNGKFGGPPFSALVVNDDDVVVFKSAITRGPSSLGLFRWRRGDPANTRLSALVRTGDPAPLPGGPAIIDLPGEPSINALGDVAFSALVARSDDAPSGRGVFAIGAGVGLRVVAMPNDPLPFVAPDAQIESIATNPLMLADGSVAFRASFGYEDPLFFSFVREDGIFRVSPTGDVALMARTTQDSPTGEPFFRFRDPNSSGGVIVVRAPLGTPETDPHPSGLFLIDPSAAIRLVLTDRDSVGNGMPLDEFSGRATVDAAGNVAFLGRVGGDESVALIHQTTSGESRILSMVGRDGPGGGQTKSVGRPAMSSIGNIAFRTSFERFDGGTPGFYLVRNGVTEPFVAVGESDPEGTGTRLSSLNPIGALNASNHLAFIGSVSEGDSRNGIFFAAPTTTRVSRLTVRGREQDVQGIPTLVASAKARLSLEVGDFGKPIAPSRQAVTIVLSDADGLLFTATVPRGKLVRRGGSFVLGRRVPGLRKLTVARGKRGVRVAFASRRWELPFRTADQLKSPITLRVDVGAHSGTVILNCTTAPGGDVSC